MATAEAIAQEINVPHQVANPSTLPLEAPNLHQPSPLQSTPALQPARHQQAPQPRAQQPHPVSPSPPNPASVPNPPPPPKATRPPPPSDPSRSPASHATISNPTTIPESCSNSTHLKTPVPVPRTHNLRSRKDVMMRAIIRKSRV